MTGMIELKPDTTFLIDYTNHAGERRYRLIVPKSFHYGRSQYHPDVTADEFYLDATDVELGAGRLFRVADIHRLTEAK
jgi:hypothetical protein